MTDVEKKEGRHDRRWKNVNMLAGQKTFTERKTEITTSKRNRQRIREMNIL